MKQKRVFYCEYAYVVGLLLLALGAALMEKADFGLSMIVAPAYLIHLKVSELFPFYTFGMSEYIFQAVLLLILSLVLRKVKRGFLFSLLTAVIYGFILDLFILLLAPASMDAVAVRILFYTAGLFSCTSAIALLFNTYIPPEAYEVFVKELSEKYKLSLTVVKTSYDVLSCLFAVALSLVLFGSLEGIGVGTVVCALVNGPLISLISRFLLKRIYFKDALPFRKYLE